IKFSDFRDICNNILSNITFKYAYDCSFYVPIYEIYEYNYKASPVNIEMKKLSSSLFCSKEPVKNTIWNAVMGDSRDKFFNGYETYLSVYNLMQFCNRLSVLEDLEPCYTVCGEKDINKWSDAICNFCDIDVFSDYLTFMRNDSMAYNCFSCDEKANGYRIPSLIELREIIKNNDNNFDKNMKFFHIDSCENPFTDLKSLFAYSKSIKDLKSKLDEKAAKKGYCEDTFEANESFFFIVCSI
ncbi:MAG: hypothetical protein K6F69_05615, partial [Treponema sp.]|nr:hypothetical protein [Treponema sp.]